MAGNATGGTSRLWDAAKRHPEIRLGYLDKVAGQPFRPDFEAAKPVVQQHYEYGRLLAAQAGRMLRKPPAWRAGVILPVALRSLPKADLDPQLVMHRRRLAGVA